MNLVSRHSHTLRLVNLVLVIALVAFAAYFTVRAVVPDAVMRRNVVVPSLAGLAPSGAVDTLTALRLAARITGEVNDSVVTAGMVASQDPAAGARVRHRSIVRLTVSAGPAFARVPDVRGADLDSARRAIIAAGLLPGRVDTTRDTVQAGRIVTTHPEPAASARRGATVAITVSEGTASIAVPDVTRLSLAEAAVRLEAAGLVVGTIRRVSEGIPGTVFGQRPAGGTLVTRGSDVHLILGEGTP